MKYKYLQAALIASMLLTAIALNYYEKSKTKDDAVNTVIIVVEHCCNEEEMPEEVQKVNTEELEMLACLIYQEAGGDAVCDGCRYRVADVVLNRINDERFPDTMYEVLTQKNQYGTMHYDGIVWHERANNLNEKHAVERAYNIANDVLSGNHSELYNNGYVWQAEFEQGSSGFWHCGIYFGK